ncbi:spore germination protein [Cohnella rhizosphaerae]|uniref:spore germination protein n=1 Tax=Cohnella rhizosphaerae TaxID=1457232 RepID=UPI0030B8EBB0
MAVAAIGTFATPSYELGLANRIVRLVLLFAVFLFQLPGFVAGSAMMLVALVMIRSYNTPYMWPFIPFNGPALLNVLLRRPLPKIKMRPSIYRPKQSGKQPSE